MTDPASILAIISGISGVIIALVTARNGVTQTQLKSLQETIETLQAENRRLRERVTELEKENDSLRAELDEIRNNQRRPQTRRKPE
jgi:cell division protein FtsB